MASFTPNIPTAAQSLGQTQQTIQDNFTSIRNDLAVDHVDIILTEKGKHKFVHLRVIGSAGNPTVPDTNSTESALYSQTVLARDVLFYKTPSNTNTIQITGVPPQINATNGSTFLPGSTVAGGLLLQWGKEPTPGMTGFVTFPVPFAVGTVPFSITLTLQRSSGNQIVTVDNGTIPSNTQFNYLSSSAGSDFLYWMAIGVAR